MSDLATAVDLASRYHVTVPTVHAWHRRGWIPCLRAGSRPVLFETAEVDKALKKRAVNRTGRSRPDDADANPVGENLQESAPQAEVPAAQ